MLPDRVSNPGPLTYESGALPIALRGPAIRNRHRRFNILLLTPNGDGGGALIKERTLESKRSGPEVIKLFSCSTQLSMTFSCL